MRHRTSQQAFCISVLLLIMCLAMGCGNADSTNRDTPNQSSMTDAQAGEEHRQQVTLRITVMS